MPRKYRKKTSQEAFTSEAMEKAVNSVLSGQESKHQAAKTYNIPRTTLKRYIDNHLASVASGSVPSYKKRRKGLQVFTDEMESALCDHIITSSKMFHGFSQVKTRELAYFPSKVCKSRVCVRKRPVITESTDESESENYSVNDSSECSSPSSSNSSLQEVEEDLCEGQFVVVRVQASSHKHAEQRFAAKILKCVSGGSMVVSFLKRSQKGKHFLFPEEADESVVRPGDVVRRLPDPELAGHTKRMSKMFVFDGDLEGIM